MKKEINQEILTCDSCGIEKSWSKDEMYFGGHPRNNWIFVHIPHHSSVIPAREHENYDFCSSKCAMEYFSKKEAK